MSLIQARPFEMVTILMKSTKCIIFDLPYIIFFDIFILQKRWSDGP